MMQFYDLPVYQGPANGIIEITRRVQRQPVGQTVEALITGLHGGPVFFVPQIILLSEVDKHTDWGKAFYFLGRRFRAVGRAFEAGTDGVALVLAEDKWRSFLYRLQAVLRGKAAMLKRRLWLTAYVWGLAGPRDGEIW
jgi:hypothetical protein